MEIKNIEQLFNAYELDDLKKEDFPKLCRAIEKGKISYDENTDKIEFLIKNQVNIFGKNAPENVLRFSELMGNARKKIASSSEDNTEEAIDNIYYGIVKMTGIVTKDLLEKVTSRELAVCEEMVNLFLL